MNQWDGKVAVVTGASSGIGKAISHCLVEQGVTVVGLGRHFETLKKTADQLKGKKGKFFPKAVDINNEAQVIALFKNIHIKLGGVHILINCAGTFIVSTLTDGQLSDWRSMLQPQLLGLSVCTREAIKSMKRSLNEGVIIHINSFRGHYIPQPNISPMNTVAKHGITVLTESLRRELSAENVQIKVTSLSPGMVRTETVDKMPSFKGKPMLETQDVCNAVIFILSAPPHLQISELTIRALWSEE